MSEYSTPEIRKIEQELARDRRHKHNSFHGHTHMIIAQMNAIIDAHSVTPRGKRLAQVIRILADELDDALKTRIDA